MPHLAFLLWSGPSRPLAIIYFILSKGFSPGPFNHLLLQSLPLDRNFQFMTLHFDGMRPIQPPTKHSVRMGLHCATAFKCACTLEMQGDSCWLSLAFFARESLNNLWFRTRTFGVKNYTAAMTSVEGQSSQTFLEARASWSSLRRSEDRLRRSFVPWCGPLKC